MVKLEQLQKHYNTFSLDCTLQVPPGRITGLVGQNGAGKTTVFKALLGLIRPDGGSVQLLGKPLEQIHQEDRQQLGVAWSDSGFSGYLTVENIIPILEQLYSRFDKPFFLEQLQKWELPIHKRIKEFSTGMKAKLKTLIAISHHAKLLILDEPTAGLDVVARDELLDLLRDYMQQDDSRSILISSHISSDLESICDDIYMIDQGRIVLHEDTDVLLGDYVFLKMNPEQYEQVDKQYLLRCQKESYGYCCLTNQRQFYQENYPALVIEKSSIDKVITMIIRGERL